MRAWIELNECSLHAELHLVRLLVSLLAGRAQSRRGLPGFRNLGHERVDLLLEVGNKVFDRDALRGRVGSS